MTGGNIRNGAILVDLVLISYVRDVTAETIGLDGACRTLTYDPHTKVGAADSKLVET